MTKLALNLESTGEAELDAILGGGLPAQSVTVIAGEPGSGKTILTLQLLFAAARRGRQCLYFTTLSEPAMKVIRYMQGFDFFDAELLKERVKFVDLGAAIRNGAEATIATLASHVESLEPDFVAIDSFRSIGELVRGGGQARAFIYDLANQITGWGATTLLVGEYARSEYPSFSEFAIADGIICLDAQRQELTSVRGIEILKMRGANYVSGSHFFDIDATGLRVYPRVRAPRPGDDTPTVGQRDSTGVKGLDALLDGGLPAGSATLVQGATGTGKTLLALHFLLEGIGAGERGIYFTLEETPDQLRQIAKGMGWDLAALEAAGSLEISYWSPVEMSTDRFLNHARKRLIDTRARRAAFDSLTTLALGVTSDRRFKELVYALAKHMRKAGISVIMTMESEQTLGTANLSGLGVSFIADNLLQLRYMEIDGRLDRAISVIKARGIGMNSELRAATIGRGGMKVSSERLTGLHGVLTGMPQKLTP